MANDYSIHIGETDISLSYVTNAVSVYNITVDIVRMTKTVTARGNTETPVTLVNLMPCHIKWKNGTEKALHKKKSYFIDAILHCQVPVGATIVTSDKVYYNSEYYEIVFINDLKNLGVLLTIGIKKIK